MAVVLTFRRLRKFIAPRWLTEGMGGLVGYSLDLVKDAYVRRMELGHLARFPQNGPNGETAPPDALAVHGLSRRLLRGRTETDAQYALRLTKWLDDRAKVGTPFALAQKIQEYVGADASGAKAQVKTVDNVGNWFVLNADGTKQTYLSQGNWQWDGDTAQWARFWVIIHAPSSIFGPSTYNWGDMLGPSWGEGITTPGATLGSTATYDDVQALRAICNDWKPLGRKCMNIILAFDPASFAPGAAPLSAGLPDTLWGRWSKVSGGVQVAARLSTARYIDGT
jgi:hypothetical protein